MVKTHCQRKLIGTDSSPGLLDDHVPQQDDTLLNRTAETLIGSTPFGLLCESLGARFLNYRPHPE